MRLARGRPLLLLGLACAPKPTPPPAVIAPEAVVSVPAPARVSTPTEIRGIWITRWTWDSASDIEGMFAHIAAAGFNTIFFQVRGQFDAYYDAALEPWAERLTGTWGGDPGWDPLAVAVSAARENGLQIHAYVNTYTLWRGEGNPPPDHPFARRPQWAVADEAGIYQAANEHYVFANPAHPEVSAHIVEVARDITTRYDVDGLHLDYLRYPAGDWSFDPISDARFAESGGTDREAWQAARIGQTVADIQDAVAVPVTAAVWGVYRDTWGWGKVSEGLIDHRQDSWGYVRSGALDAIVPMIYWPVAEEPGDRLDFAAVVADHVGNAGGPVWAGVGGEQLTYEELLGCIAAAREAGAQGVVLFDYSLWADRLDELGLAVFAETVGGS